MEKIVLSAGVITIPELWFGTFLAESPLGKLKGAVRVRVIKHLHLLAVDPESP